MSAQQKRKTSFPPAAVAAIAVCLCGYLYCLNLPAFFEAEHWYLFAVNVRVSAEEFHGFLSYFSTALFVYYSMYLAVACMLYLNMKKQLPAVLLTAAAVRLITLVMLLIPGGNLAFQFGFEALMEIMALSLIAFISLKIPQKPRLYHARITVMVIGVLGEIIPLVRNMPAMLFESINLPARLAFVALPCATAAFTILLIRRCVRAYAPPEPEETEAEASA